MWEITSSSADRLFAISNFVLIVGAAAVLIGTIGTIVLSGVREQFANERISTNEAETNRAIAESELAKSGAAEANARAAEANQKASEAQLKLAEFRKPRGVTAEQAALIIDKISPFTGSKFDVGHDFVGREVWDFLWQLEPVISRAGWVHIDWIGPQTFKKNGWPGDHNYGLANVSNVSIEVHPQAPEKLKLAAEALAEALRDINITVTTTDFNNASMNMEAVHLLVGPKQ
jgi:hypothetical protein